MDMMLISQLAARSGVPASTLRFYDSAGLLPAARTAAGYRLYGEEAVERLGLISGQRWRTAPVACSLPSGDLPGRAAAWRAATSGATAAAIPDGMRLTLPADRAAAVAGLAAAEQDCCPFLDFRLHLDGPVLHLEVRAPSDAAGLLAALFTPDRPQPTPPPSCSAPASPGDYA